MALNTALHYNIRNLNDASLENGAKCVTLKTSLFNSKYLIHKAIVLQNLRKRQGTASCKTRSEVQGGGKKPWKQKGTGRARAGSSTSPLWKGGGVSFGPQPRIYSKKLNFRERQLALSTALYNSSSKLIIVQDFLDTITKPSTKEILNQLKKLVSIQQYNHTLFVVHEVSDTLNLSVRNIKHLTLVSSETLGIREILRAKTILMTEKALINISNVANNYHGH
uniref:Large ribosomal subunit protein uL4c n=1 Tax=Cryptomonas sp. SAG 977-2f TaxID=279061 RepID=A0A679CA50_9CRYP|nr:ribosomal protein L4 [Cryptomonas sp. SAG 977-2f]